jgi:Predicted acyl-CoA transferases/carnitine dehydratase
MIEQDRRNQRSILLDIPSPEGRKIFFTLIKDAHIFIESSKGGQWAEWGLTDEVLWEQNAALVIVHCSGYGQDGIPEYVRRPSYDPVAQAFSGFLALQGDDHSGPIMGSPQLGDSFMSLIAAASALAALNKAQKPGGAKASMLLNMNVYYVSSRDILRSTLTQANNFLVKEPRLNGWWASGLILAKMESKYL